jgi:hypothetical protein
MMTLGGIVVYFYFFLTYALAGGELSASRRGRFILGSNCIGGWVGSTASLDDVERRKSRLYRGPNSETSVVQPVDSRYTDYAKQLKCNTFVHLIE